MKAAKAQVKVKGAIAQADFEAWLRAQGADILPTTNPWELARFRARDQIHIIYTRANGTITAQDFGLECLAAFRRGGTLSMTVPTKRRGLSHRKEILLKRDGSACFFCGQEMSEEEMTIEHLVPLMRGGPNIDDNLALAHEACNQKAGAAPLVEKIRAHCEARIQKAIADFALHYTIIQKVAL